MIIKSYIVEQNIEILENYKATLIYGKNYGIKEDIKHLILIAGFYKVINFKYLKSIFNPILLACLLFVLLNIFLQIFFDKHRENHLVSIIILYRKNHWDHC